MPSFSVYRPVLNMHRKQTYQTGFTLTELLVAMLLGVLVLIAAASLFSSGWRTHRTTDAVSRIQEQQRLAFELMARDIRHAGSFPCKEMNDPVWLVGRSASSDDPDARYFLANTLIGNMHGETTWGTDPSQQKNYRDGFDSITLLMDPAISSGWAINPEMIGGETLYPVVEHKRPGADLKVLNLDKSGLDKDGLNQYLIVCNAETAIVFDASAVNSNTISITMGNNIGNICGGGFTRMPNITPHSMDCVKTEPVGPGYCFWGDMSIEPSEEDKAACDEIGQSQAYVYSLRLLVHMPMLDGSWFVDKEHNLWRGRYNKVAEGVTSLQLRYRLKGTKQYLDAQSISASGKRFDFSKRKGAPNLETDVGPGNYSDAWSKVDSVHLKMRFQSPDNIGTDGKPLERTMETYIAIRSRMPEMYP